MCNFVFSDKTMVNKHLLTVLVRLFLEKHELLIQNFVSEFAKLTVSDEKVSSSCSCHLYVTFIALLFSSNLRNLLSAAVGFLHRKKIKELTLLLKIK
jgi:hypothetical protein